MCIWMNSLMLIDKYHICSPVSFCHDLLCYTNPVYIAFLSVTTSEE